MTYEQYLKLVLDLAWLARCAVEGTVPDHDRARELDLEALYRLADQHLLTSITAMALESAGIKDPAFTQAMGKAIRKAALFDAERAAVLAELERAGIWYLPLKGCLLKNLYPALGMRQMADNDILFDASRSEDVRRIMEKLDFTVSSFGYGCHDKYQKPPVVSFEMHRRLFDEGHDAVLRTYYQNVRERLLPDGQSACGLRFSDEDFYLYQIAHKYKHYSGGGTGLRSLLDTWVYLRAKGDGLDRAYLSAELEKLGLTGYEAENRSLALHLFGGEPLTEADRKMLDYILSSGTYGNIGNSVQNSLRKEGGGIRAKVRYFFRRLYGPVHKTDPQYSAFAEFYGPFYRHWYLRPLLPFYRLWRSRKRARAEVRALIKAK